VNANTTFVAQWSGGGGNTSTAVTFSSVSANGSSTQTTTELTLIFSQAITGLSASDITLSGVSGVIKGTLSGSGPTCTLPISGFTAGGTLSVAVSKSGYTISGSPKTTTIYYYSAPTVNAPAKPRLSGTVPSSGTIRLTWSFSTGSGYSAPTSILVRIYEPTSKTWATVETLSGTATSYSFAYGMWADSEGLVMMGIIGSNSAGNSLPSVLYYNWKTNKWTTAM
jgi:hypothetical protein